MKKETVIKIQLLEPNKSLFEGAIKELRLRGVKDLGLSSLVERCLLTLNEKSISDLIEELTPIEFRIKAALQDDKKKKQMLRIINARCASEDQPSEHLGATI
jgi:hypothetical protein